METFGQAKPTKYIWRKWIFRNFGNRNDNNELEDARSSDDWAVVQISCQSLPVGVFSCRPWRPIPPTGLPCDGLPVRRFYIRLQPPISHTASQEGIVLFVLSQKSIRMSQQMANSSRTRLSITTTPCFHLPPPSPPPPPPLPTHHLHQMRNFHEMYISYT